VARGEASAGEGPPPGSPFAGLSTLFSPQLALAATTAASASWGTSPGVCLSLFFFLELGFELRTLHLQKQAFYCLGHNSSPFCSGYFAGGGLSNCLPSLASNCNSPDLSLPGS
jgi:hypothetical protein